LAVFLILFTLCSIFFISVFKYNPYFTLRYVKMQHDYAYTSAGNIFKVKWFIKKEKENAGAVPVLLYHGINEEEDGVSPELFKKQMRALKNAGWRAITLTQFEKFSRGEESVPAKSFLITFEDGRKDSYYNADPILRSLGFKAVMFVIADYSLVKTHNFHLTKYELGQMQATGRWEIESHGGQNHSFYNFNSLIGQAYGSNDNFALEKRYRLESGGAFAARVRADLISAKKNIEKELGKEVSALAFPFDNEPDSNALYKEAQKIVLAEAVKIYKTIFYDLWPKSRAGYSANYPQSEKNQIFKRINIMPGWSEKDLLQIASASADKRLPYAENSESIGNWINLSGHLASADNVTSLFSDKGIFNAYLDGSYSWKDYTVSAKLDAFDSKRTLSLMFRYVNADNYFSCEYRENKVTLKRTNNKKETILSEIQTNNDYKLKKDTVLGVKVNKDNAQCLIDNTPILSQSNVKMAKNGGVGIKLWDKLQIDYSTSLKDIKVYPSDEDWEAITTEAGPEIVYNFLDQGSLEAADLMLDNIYRIERYKDVKINTPIGWREDPYKEEYWRFLFYSLQPTRHLMSAWQKTGNEVYKDKMVEIVESFIDRGMDSPNSWDKHGTAYRTMVLANIAGKLKKNKMLSKELESKITKALVRHGEFLADPSNYEGDYNHGLDQAIALFHLAVNYPQIKQSASWKNIAAGRLQNGLGRIIDADGVLVENSPYYHFYALGKYWELYQYLNKNKMSVSENFDRNFEAKIKKMVAYAARIMQPDLHVPTIGASLDSKINNFGIYKDIGKFDENFLYSLTNGSTGKKPDAKFANYQSAGQAIMRSGWDKNNFKNESQLIFDAGEYRTNHSDLDALSFHLYGLGSALMPDSGLYTYESGAYRNYFHGTRSHNTVVVDNQSQSEGTEESKGEIDAGKVYAGQLITGEDFAYQTAWHTLYNGVVHNRSIAMIEDKAIAVVDYLDSEAAHYYEQMFHLFPGAKIERNRNIITVKDEKDKTVMRIIQLLPEQMGYSNQINNKRTGEGLCSKEYEKSEPCYSLSFSKKGASATFITLILLGEENPAKYNLASNRSRLDISTDKKNYRISINKNGGSKRTIAVDKKNNYSVNDYHPVMIEDMTSADEWIKTNETGNDGSISEEIDTNKEKILKVVTPSNDSFLHATKKTNLDLTDKNLLFQIKVADRGDMNTATFYLSNNNWKNFASFDILGHFIQDNISNEWVSVGLGKGQNRSPKMGNWNFYLPGFDWSKVDQIRFRLASKTVPQEIAIGPVSTVEKMLQPRVLIMFDDGWDDVLNAAKIMNKYNMKGNVGVIGTNVGKKQYLTVENLQELQNKYGWSIVSHSYLHKDAVDYYYKNNDASGYKRDIENNIYYLTKNKINSAPNWFVYPYGKSNEWSKKIVSKYYTFARGTQNAPEFFPYADPLSVKVLSVYSDRIDANGVVAALRDADKFDSVLFLMFHKFSEYTPELYTEFSLSQFEDIIKKIYNEGPTIMTLSELDKYYKIGQNSITVKESEPAKLSVRIAEYN